MFKVLSVSFLFVFLLNVIASESDRAELLKIHQQGRRAHFETDVDLLLSNQAEQFMSVSNGKIHRETREGSKKFFTEYFKDAKYLEWDDLEPPIIRISSDGSMAWMITRVKVRRIAKAVTGESKEQSFVYAGIMTYEKQNGRWVAVANVSTFE